MEFAIQKAYPTGKVPLNNSKVDDIVKLQPYNSKIYMSFFVIDSNSIIADEKNENLE